MAGYSGSPLTKKLGIRSGMNLLVENAPRDYREILEDRDISFTMSRRLSRRVDLIHLFTTSAEQLAKRLAAYRRGMKADGVIWVSWPKKAAKVPTDITEDVIRQIAIPMGLVDIKVCAVDEVWSGLKLVIRVALRT